MLPPGRQAHQIGLLDWGINPLFLVDCSHGQLHCRRLAAVRDLHCEDLCGLFSPEFHRNGLFSGHLRSELYGFRDRFENIEHHVDS